MAELNRPIWEPEEIPNAGKLFMRVHVRQLLKDKLHPGIFRPHRGRSTDSPAGMSTDWEKYSTAEQTRNRHPNPESNGVISLIAGIIRSIEGLRVQHEPINDNSAHTEVYGLEGVNKVRRRKKLFDHFNVWLIDPYQASPF